MEEFDQLSSVLDRLLAPDGCPWDQEQTLHTLRSTVLEEVCELIEAIDIGDNRHIQEELGDLFFNALFFCKVAEKEQRFTANSVLAELTEKLIRRHPHVFGDAQVEDSAAVVRQWESIKSAEPHNSERKSALDGIPKGLPSLARAQKALRKLKKAGHPAPCQPFPKTFSDETALGELLGSIALAAELQGLDAEQALRSYLAQHEEQFRNQEQEKGR